MKGIVGMVSCDAEGCPSAFMTNDVKVGHVNAMGVADAAETGAIAEGWTVERKGLVKHYCPAHSLVRSQAAADKR